MPAFLDFLFPFGQQVKRSDFHFSGFRSEDRLKNPGPCVQILGRSGLGLQQSYNLKAAEQCQQSTLRPWCIRQTAVYHSFDQRSGHCVWIIATGNSFPKKKIFDSEEARSRDQLPCSETTSFKLTLKSHLLCCEWAWENWPSYISYLNANSEEATKKTTIDAAIKSSRGSETRPGVVQGTLKIFNLALDSKS